MLTLVLSRIYDAGMNPGIVLLCIRSAKLKGFVWTKLYALQLPAGVS